MAANTEKEPVLNSKQDDNDDNSGPKRSTYETFEGIMAVVVYVFLFVTSATCVALLDRAIPDFELNGLRFFTGFAAMGITLIFKRSLPVLEKSQVAYVALYGLVQFLASSVQFMAVTLIPLSTSQSVYMTANIISGLFLFTICVKENLKVKQMFCAVLCLIGVFLVLQPTFVFKNVTENVDMPAASNHTDAKNFIDELSPHSKRVLGVCLAILNGVFICCTLLMAKKQPYLMENVVSVLFWAFLVGTVLSVVVMLIIERPVILLGWYNNVQVIMHCLTFVFTIPLMLFALKRISGNTFNIVLCTSVVFMLIPQYTVLSDILPGHRNWIEVFGVFIVLIGSTLTSAFELYKSVKESRRRKLDCSRKQMVLPAWASVSH